MVEEQCKNESVGRKTITTTKTKRWIDDLIQRILDQPPNRKGRYIALESLLPLTGANRLLSYTRTKRNNDNYNNDSSSNGDDDENNNNNNNKNIESNESVQSSSLSSSSSLLDDLLCGIGDRGGYNTGAIADLWAKLVKKLWSEMKPPPPQQQQQQQQDIVSDVEVSSNDDDRRNNDNNIQIDLWLDIWVPSLARALTHPPDDPIRRKQVAAFCLPRITESILNDESSQSKTNLSVNAYGELLRQVSYICWGHSPEIQKDNKSATHAESTVQSPSSSCHQESVADRILWAQIEIVRSAGTFGFLKPMEPKVNDKNKITGKQTFLELVADLVTMKQLKEAATHSSLFIRIVAFQAIQYVVIAFRTKMKYPEPVLSLQSLSPSMDCIMYELDVWKYALPFAVKTDSKEYVTSILYCLLSFMDRLSIAEASLVCKEDQDNKAPNQQTNKQPYNEALPVLYSFVVNFLLDDMIARKMGYPGTVELKESFLLPLLECIIVFVARNHPLTVDSKLLPKTSAIFHRKRHVSEVSTIRRIQRAILSKEILASLVSLLHSTWDNTRSYSFKMLISLIRLSKDCSLPLPKEYTSDCAKSLLEARGLFLASSPRQREADTGARLLAFLCHSMTLLSDKIAFLDRAVSFLDKRLIEIREKLTALLSDNSDLAGGYDLPLAHGIIHCMHLVIENDELIQNNMDCSYSKIFHRMTNLFCQAIRVSLAVVADVKAGEMIDGMDEDLALTTGTACKSSKVNPGALGANGIFSSVTHISKDDHLKRLASQRIVVGSWLLTKETCVALSALLTARRYVADKHLFSDAGMLLISTLTSLKHAGAAFAAHRALQQMVSSCYKADTDSYLHEFPPSWVSRLLCEISETDKVKDSTLRRSTGYALGFLSVMRSEVASRSFPRPLCRNILSNLIKMSLPSRVKVREFLTQMGMTKEEQLLLLSFSSDTEIVGLAADDTYSTRSRVHALNVLRLMLLDATLAQDIIPFVGVAFVSAVFGYMDTAWSVRNSSTMVFSAAMVRSIDPDKNASNSDETSSKATTISEVFRLYPLLPRFLLAVSEGCLSDTKIWEQQENSLPPILLILLLFVRVQPVSQSGKDSITQVEPFIPIIIRCLGHPYIAVRTGAARALQNLSSNEKHSTTASISILSACQSSLLSSVRHSKWNICHGSLLAVRDLALRSCASAEFIRSCRIYEELLRISDVSHGFCIAPPICISVTLEILEAVANRHHLALLLQRCEAITKWIDRTSKLPWVVPGAADLRATIAKIRTKITTSSLWTAAASSNEFKASINNLESLLTSDESDSKTIAIKLFKKTIYTGLDLCVKHGSRELLRSLNIMLLRAVQLEINRNFKSMSAVRSHNPSVRRLSRCLLESIEAFLRVDTNGFSNELYDEFRRLGLSMEKFLPSHGQRALLTLSDGNALELIAYKTFEADRNDPQGKLSHYINLIGVLSDPIHHWRLRYSAATAIRVSKILSKGIQTVSETAGVQGGHSIVEVFLDWLTLMHDCDEDVRIAASKAAPIYHVERCSPISEVTLVGGFDCFCSVLPKSQLTAAMFRKIDDLTKNLPLKSELVLGELRFSEGVHDCDVTCNIGAERKIFEEEDPNPYHESCLSGQLAVRGLVNGFVASDKLLDLTNNTIEVLLRRCQGSLLVLHHQLTKEVVTGADMIHNISRNNQIFPDLHNLLLGTACVLIYMMPHSSNFQSDKVEMTEFLETVQSVWDLLMHHHAFCATHPCVVESIQVMVSIIKNESDCQIKILKCCFLIH